MSVESLNKVDPQLNNGIPPSQTSPPSIIVPTSLPTPPSRELLLSTSSEEKEYQPTDHLLKQNNGKQQPQILQKQSNNNQQQHHSKKKIKKKKLFFSGKKKSNRIDGDDAAVAVTVADDDSDNESVVVGERKSKCKMQIPAYSYFQLFKYSTKWEKLLTIFGIILVTFASFGLPYNVIMYGEYTALLIDRAYGADSGLQSTKVFLIQIFGGGHILQNATKEENRVALIQDATAYGLGSAAGALIQLILIVIGLDLVNLAAIKQITRVRKLFFKAILRQDMSWYDTVSGNNFAARITEDLEKMKEGMADKLAICVYLLATCAACIGFALFYGWKLTLVILSCAPLIIISSAFVAKMQASLTTRELESYAKAGSVAEEVLSSIRTVVAFGGMKKEVQRYKNNLSDAEKTGLLKGVYSGLGGGLMWLFIYFCYALAFWYGLQLIVEDRDRIVKEYTSIVLVVVLFGVLIGAQNLGFTSPHLEAFGMAIGSSKYIFEIISRRPAIDSLGKLGLRPNIIKGHIEFQNCYFNYPARPDVEILKGLTLSIPAGKTVALVGMSGCGKSTCLQLLQRLYDPEEGSVYLDGIDVKDLNISHLRSFIGVVGQEPVLFSTSIAENIRFGKPTANQMEIEKACRIANCHDFIIKLPNGYDTLVGERGGQLSGGQKQRIAIARALIRNPTILILDEATSALDPNSERLVQNALDKASEGRTTVVVSHRLSTITNADKIVFIEKGRVSEQGTHKQLLEQKGLYYQLVNAKSDDKSDTKSDISKIKKKPRTVSEKSNGNYNVSKDLENKLNDVIPEKSIAIDNDDDDDDDVDDDDEDDDRDKSDEKDQDKYKVSMFRIFKLNKPEWKYLLLGSIAAIAVGSSLPMFAILFGEFFGIMSNPNSEEVLQGSRTFALYFVGLGLFAGFGTFFQGYLFNVAGVRLTSRLRTDTFKAMMNQEMGWFDNTRNGVGMLCARLAGDCASVQGACGVRLGSILLSFSTLVIGIMLSLYFSWKLTLVAIISIPVILAVCYYESKYTAMSALKEKEAMENGCRMAVEAISNIRTVASLGQETYIIARYNEELNNAEKACRSKIRYRGTVYGLGQTVPLFGYALAFYYGGILVANEGLHYKDVIKVSECLIFGAWMLSQALSYAPNVNVAILSAGRLLKLLDREPQYVDPPLKTFLEKKPDDISGNVEFSQVAFHYPTRQNIPILQDINLTIPCGKSIALVGPSGCGKSTCIQLLLRYYDPIGGSVLLDNHRTVDFPMSYIRSQIGLVSQEPILFDRTIAENISYGDNERENIPMNEIIAAATQANINNFISSLPAGYETSLGSKGAQLSGGQKQRIAIARALVRQPKILLLDEATSSLDSHSENVVQAALDKASNGRTCITIAHRLSTIQNVDQICVLQNGVIVEQGTHAELISLGKIYNKLYEMQQVN